MKIWGNRVSPSPCRWGRQPLPTAVGTWGNRVSPSPCRWGASRSQPRLGHGETGFPHLPAGGGPAAHNRGWDMGKPGFPTPLPGGRVWEGAALPDPPARGGQNVWAPTGGMAWGCAGWSSLRPRSSEAGAGRPEPRGGCAPRNPAPERAWRGAEGPESSRRPGRRGNPVLPVCASGAHGGPQPSRVSCAVPRRHAPGCAHSRGRCKSVAWRCWPAGGGSGPPRGKTS